MTKFEKILKTASEKGINLYEQFKSFSSKQDIHKFWNISDNSAGCKLVSKIADYIGFNLETYKKKRLKPCLNCGRLTKNEKFCSRSCSAIYNNLHRDPIIYKNLSTTLSNLYIDKNSITTNKKINNKKISKPKEKIIYYCLHCQKELDSKRKYCNSKCAQQHRHELAYKHYLEHPEQYNRGNYTPKSFYDKFLERQNGICALCPSTTEHNGKPLRFVIDHIDGDASNNHPNNIRLICPNCDSQTDTFKSKNKNSKRRNYYREKILRQLNNVH